MNSSRLNEIIARYPHLRLAVVGDFCLDRYLEIDPSRTETSIETGLPVHNVVNVRSQPGAAGTILNNLAALGVGTIYPIGFAGVDGEGAELTAALEHQPGLRLDGFIRSEARRTFTYCKPLLLREGRPPEELNRLDIKNWTPTPEKLQDCLVRMIQTLAPQTDALIVMDQVDIPETGVVTRTVRDALGDLSRARPERWLLADSRRGLSEYPPMTYKMNRQEFGSYLQLPAPPDPSLVPKLAQELAQETGFPVFVTLAEDGLVGATPAGPAVHTPALPPQGEIDIVGAGDAVTANLIAALAAGATLEEALQIASLAAHIVIHQLGTTGVATPTSLLQTLTRLLPTG